MNGADRIAAASRRESIDRGHHNDLVMRALAPEHLVAAGGMTLAEWLAGDPDPEARAALACSICQALADLHEAGIVLGGLDAASVRLTAPNAVGFSDWSQARCREGDHAAIGGQPLPTRGDDVRALSRILDRVLEGQPQAAWLDRLRSRSRFLAGPLPSARALADSLAMLAAGLEPPPPPLGPPDLDLPERLDDDAPGRMARELAGERTQVVVLLGAVGSGKRRLMHRAAALEGTEPIYCKPDSARATAIALVAELARAAQRRALAMDPEAQRTWVASAHAHAESDLGPWVGLLPELGVFFGRPEAGRADPAALLALLDALPGPTLIVLDHADEIAADVLAQFVSLVLRPGLAGPRQLVLLAESHLNALNLMAEPVSVLVNEALTESDVAAWLSGLSGLEAPPAGNYLAARLAEHTGGNAELIRAHGEEWWARDVLIHDPETGYTLYPPNDAPLLEASNFLTLLRGRFDALPASTRALLSAGAVAGGRFRRHDLAAMGFEVADCRELFSQLRVAIRARLLQVEVSAGATPDDALTFTFRHPQLAEYAYAAEGDATQRRRHAALADSLRDGGSGGLELLDLAGHVNAYTDPATGDWESRLTVARLNLAAGRLQSQCQDPRAAFKHFKTALSILGGDGWQRAPVLTSELVMACAHAALDCGDLEQIEALEGAASNAQRMKPERHAELLLIRAHALATQGRFADALAAARSAESLVEDDPAAAGLAEAIRMLLLEVGWVADFEVARSAARNLTAAGNPIGQAAETIYAASAKGSLAEARARLNELDTARLAPRDLALVQALTAWWRSDDLPPAAPPQADDEFAATLTQASRTELAWLHGTPLPEEGPDSPPGVIGAGLLRPLSEFAATLRAPDGIRLASAAEFRAEIEAANEFPLLMARRCALQALSYALAGDLPAAVTTAGHAEGHLDHLVGSALLPTTMALLSLRGDARSRLNRRILGRWGAEGSRLAACLHGLVCAETSAIDDRRIEWLRGAAQSAEAGGYPPLLALSQERLAVALAAAGDSNGAAEARRLAHSLYDAWGAHAKVTDMERAARRTDLAASPRELNRLDLEAVVRASEILASELDPGQVLRRLVELALEHSGAQHAALRLQGQRRSDLVVTANASDGEAEAISGVPRDVFTFALRQRKPIVVNNPGEDAVFGHDPYIRKVQPRSIAAFPLIKGDNVSGVLYLEHREFDGVFTVNRADAVHAIARQAAISIENAELYAQLQQASREYRTLFDHAAEGLLRATVEGALSAVNATLASMLGFPSTERALAEIARFERLFADGDDADRFLERLRKEGQVVDFEAEARRRDGTRFFALINAWVWTDEDGDRHLDGSVIDVSDRRRRQRAEQQRQVAEEATRAKSEFLASMSHEIRTPLNAIIGFTHLMEETRLDPAQRDYLATVRAASESLLSIVNDVLDFSRIEAGKIELDPRPFPLARELEDVRRLFATDATKKSLDLVLIDYTRDAERGLWRIGDPERLRQILVNLVSNAIKFTDQGAVRIFVAESEGQIEIEVEDTGIGIAPEAQERLFDQFEQLETSASRRYGGSGLGLAITRRLVELMQGRIEVESTPGVGSVFKVRLPLPPAPAEQESRPSDAEEAQQLAGLRVLIAEDNPINQQLMVEYLSSVGAIATIVEGGHDAVQRACEGDHDVVLLDLHMPDMDGITACRQIRARVGRDLPIIAVTADALVTSRSKAREAGIDDYLIKPIEPNTVLDTLRRHCANRRTGTAAKPSAKAPAAPSPGSRHAARQATRLPGIDLPTALRRHAGNSKLLVKLMGDFIKYYGDAHARIRDAMQGGDCESIERLAHNLKGVSGSFGAADLHEACRELEAAAEAGIASGLAPYVTRFEKAHTQMLENARAIAAGEIDLGDVP